MEGRPLSRSTLVFIFLLAACPATVYWTSGHVTEAASQCTGPAEVSVSEGTAWVAQDGCNVCTCTQFGVECQTWKNCDNHNHLGDPGQALCSYGQSHQYTVGQTWLTMDGCNHCVCTDHGMNCTAHPCTNTGFAHPKPAGSSMDFMDCPYKDRIYRYRDHFLADDGCNTCYCIMPGNYATFPACTTTPCDLVG